MPRRVRGCVQVRDPRRVRQGGAAAPAMPREHAPLLDLLYLTNDVSPVRGARRAEAEEAGAEAATAGARLHM